MWVADGEMTVGIEDAGLPQLVSDPIASRDEEQHTGGSEGCDIRL